MSLIGLGYVGLPIAVAFAETVDVIGFDVNNKKIELMQAGVDPTLEVGDAQLKKSKIKFTSDESRLREAQFHIVAVPTPVHADHTPNLQPIIKASETLGRNLTSGSIVVYESTVFPGVTEDICVPILERESGLKCGIDFKVGYSPERINPGDKKHTLATITKIVSGMDAQSLAIIAKVYALVVKAGVFEAESIKVAEAAKVIENSQRDINIAFMNELSIVFHKMEIDTQAVLKAAKTKWNFLDFVPGLVGGHCIGVDPYYLTYQAEQLGYHSQIILAGRRINDDMGKYVAENLIKTLIHADIPVKNARVAILGFTFKENVPDTRNTKVIDVVKELRDFGIDPVLVDDTADAEEARLEYGIEFTPIDQVRNMSAVVLAVNHDSMKTLTPKDFDRLFSSCQTTKRILFDLKGVLNKDLYTALGYQYWRL